MRSPIVAEVRNENLFLYIKRANYLAVIHSRHIKAGVTGQRRHALYSDSAGFVAPIHGIVSLHLGRSEVYLVRGLQYPVMKTISLFVGLDQVHACVAFILEVTDTRLSNPSVRVL